MINNWHYLQYIFLRNAILNDAKCIPKNESFFVLKGFTDDERSSLAQMTALWLASGQIPATILPVLIQV